MKRLVFLLCLFFTFGIVYGQKYAVVDMEYVLKNIPAYETANDQLDQISKKWQKEVEAVEAEAKTMSRNFETEMVFLSDEMKKQRATEIVAKEKEASDLKRHYFGPGGELEKKREALIRPIQDEIYNALKELCEEHKCQMILDRSTSPNIVYLAPKLDVSDDLLQKLGYLKSK